MKINETNLILTYKTVKSRKEHCTELKSICIYLDEFLRCRKYSLICIERCICVFRDLDFWLTACPDQLASHAQLYNADTLAHIIPTSRSSLAFFSGLPLLKEI
ncbi:hypothetical protein T4D_6928 [Trichinella pseudospiralis]|uniref:Uncharacterized protein n=1 Tax=Trichinella pseudospiralis TaxID=6337 RepID=A0A0V1FZZ5_TRIPS|nr:hypothetical protein T4D_6928 [Trichinella pseudospiralis]